MTPSSRTGARRGRSRLCRALPSTWKCTARAHRSCSPPMAEVALPIMATPAVGEDIDALCGKCGQVWHVVMAKVGERIAKVVCKRCGGQHLYRTEQSGEAAASGERPVSGAKRPLRSRTPEPPALPVPAFDPSKAPRPYSALEAFTAGDRVVHTTFGTGVVTGSPGPGKVEIAFNS